MFLPTETLYRGTAKHYSVVKVLQRVYHVDTRMSNGYTACMDKKSKHTTMRFTPQDMQAIEKIREAYGCISDMAAVRLALQIVARGSLPAGSGAFIPPPERGGSSRTDQ